MLSMNLLILTLLAISAAAMVMLNVLATRDWPKSTKSVIFLATIALCPAAAGLLLYSGTL